MPDAHPCEFLDRAVALAREGFEDCGFLLLRMAAFGSSGHSTGSALLLLRVDLHTYIEWRRWIEFLDARNTRIKRRSVTWLDQSGIHDSEPPNSVGVRLRAVRALPEVETARRTPGRGVVPPSQSIRLVRTSSALFSGPSAASGRKTGAGLCSSAPLAPTVDAF